MIGGRRARQRIVAAHWIGAALLLPTAILAQRPGIGTLGRGLPQGIRRDPGIQAPAHVNIVNLIIEHRQDLALTDTQFVRVISVKRALDSTNAPLLRRVDSVTRLFKGGPMFGNPSPARRDSVAQGQALVRELSADVEENIADAKDRALALLSPLQAQHAEQIEDKARQAGAPARGGRL